MVSSFLEKINVLKNLFQTCSTNEARYQKIMEAGKTLPFFPEHWKCHAALVPGCQSVMYLHTTYENGLLTFAAASDALISAGLAALLIQIYNEESPELVLKHPPIFLQEFGIIESLSPSRANGVTSLYVKMKQEALHMIVQQTKSPSHILPLQG